MNRRNFIGKAAAGAAAFTVIPRHVLGGNGYVAANDKINLGYIGTGKQSIGLMRSIARCKETVVLAASDVYGAKLDLFVDAAVKANSDSGLNQKVDKYTFYRDMLERSDIDAVVIVTPDHWHAQNVVDAAKAGKDIYCEKPLSLTVAEGRAMVNATRKYDRVFQTGNMQRSWRNFRHCAELIRNGYIGDIKQVNVAIGLPVRHCSLPVQEVPATLNWNEWVGPSVYRGYHADLAPPVGDERWAWWRGYRDFGGGEITDWGAHMFDIVQWALDMDESGPIQFIPPSEPADYGLSFKYANGTVVTHTRWVQGNAIQFIGTEGRIEVSREYLRTFPNEGLAKAELKSTDKRVYVSDNHYQDWVDAIKKRSRPIADVETGHRTASVCNVANIAYELQRPLLWNPVAETFTGDAGANMMLTRPYRGKWDFNAF
jgi:predicted dehydrogenase